MKLNYRHTLKATLAVESIRNETQSDISRCCAARLQFIKGNLPLVLGAATPNGFVSIKELKPIRRPTNSITCLSCSKAASSRSSVVLVRSESLKSNRDTTISPIKKRTLNDLFVLSKKYIEGSCKGIGERNNAGKREFGTLVLEKVHKVILVFPYLSGQLFLELNICCFSIYAICSLYFSNSNNALGPQKTLLQFQTIYLPYFQKTIKTILNLWIHFINSYYSFWPRVFQIKKNFSEFLEIPVPQTQMISKNTLRKYLLISLNDVKSPSPLTAESIIARLNRIFLCNSILVCFNKKSGHHRIHVGVWNQTASKNTVQSVLRKAFPELEEQQCHKTWNAVCLSILKKDGETLTVWGEKPPEEILKKARASSFSKNWQSAEETAPAPEKKKESKTKTASAPKKINSIEIVPSTRRITNAEILQRLHKTSTWNEVLNDEILGPRCVTNYTNIRNIYVDLWVKQISTKISCLPILIKELLLLFIRALFLNNTIALRILFFLIIGILYLLFGILSSIEFEFFTNLLDSFYNFIASLWKPELEPEPEPEPEPSPSATPSLVAFAIVAAMIIFYFYFSNN